LPTGGGASKSITANSIPRHFAHTISLGHRLSSLLLSAYQSTPLSMSLTLEEASMASIAGEPHHDKAAPADLDDMALCSKTTTSPTATKSTSQKPKRRRSKRNGPAHLQLHQPQETLAGAFRMMLVRHQLGLSLNLVLLLAFTHTLFPALRAHTSAFFAISYPSSSQPGLYAQGPNDMYMVGSFVVLFTGLRAFLLDYAFMPLASRCGIQKQKARVRFAEQAYVLSYYGFYWCWGVYLFVQDTPAEVNSINSLLQSMWRDFPRLLLPAGIKVYYLSQLAQWIQMVLVIHIEEKRKDHYQMLAHHLITIALMAGSYANYQCRVGMAILICMDFVDCVFPLAKILRYLALQRACDVMFGVFVISWILSRHVAYLSICWSIYAHLNTPGINEHGTYSAATGAKLSSTPYLGAPNPSLLTNPISWLSGLAPAFLRPDASTITFSATIRWTFLALLMALQGITLLWLFMIFRVVVKVLRGEGAEDSRSDDEGDDDDENENHNDDDGISDDDDEFDASDDAVLLTEEKPRFIEVSPDDDVDNGEWTAANTAVRNAAQAAASAQGSNSSGNSRKKSRTPGAGGISSGLGLVGDHKDILNRIGCLSEEQLAREREKREGGGGGSPKGAGGKDGRERRS
jgi:acyl-CoA-dependent ceramide synthase